MYAVIVAMMLLINAAGGSIVDEAEAAAVGKLHGLYTAAHAASTAGASRLLDLAKARVAAQANLAGAQTRADTRAIVLETMTSACVMGCVHKHLIGAWPIYACPHACI